MKENLQEIRKKFDARCEEFRSQLVAFKNNNEAIDALKKAHAREIAAHVQEHNSKYNKLLQDKLDSEDNLREQAEKEKAQHAKDWEAKLKAAV